MSLKVERKGLRILRVDMKPLIGRWETEESMLYSGTFGGPEGVSPVDSVRHAIDYFCLRHIHGDRLHYDDLYPFFHAYC